MEVWNDFCRNGDGKVWLIGKSCPDVLQGGLIVV